MNASARRIEKAHDAIAICGMALRLPGGVSSTEDFWSLLLSKRSGHGPIPASRFNIDGFHSPIQPSPPSTIRMRHGYFLDDEETDIRQFDASFFTNMSRSEVERLDPQQRLLLEVVYESVEAAGDANSFRGERIGCFVGTFGQDWGELQSVDKMSSGLYRITGQGDFLLSNRVSFEYDLKGPSFTVKTACSSSLVALHLACQALQRGECSGAVVGGTNLIVAPDMSIAMTEQGIVSADGRCKSFDASADGYGRGEAINAVYLKRLDDALADGNPIRAVIVGTGINSDGRSPSLASPASEAHEALIRDTYAAAGLRVADTPLVECHATGTAVGDPLEAAAIAHAFGETTETYMGSVKPNVGHSEGASGITSLIKAVLALENRTIPPNVNFSTPNPKIPFKDANLIVPTQPTPWPEGRPARASVNSFGLGGANAHAILEAAPPTTSGEEPKPSAVRLPPEEALLVFSAKHPESLDRMVRNCRDYLTKKKDSAASLHDVAHTLACRREHMRHRAFVVTGDDRPDFGDTALKKGSLSSPSSSSSAAATTPALTMVFSGQGAQWPGMCASLLEHFAAFADAIDRMDRALQGLAEPPGWTIRDQLSNPSDRVHSAEFAQPLCTAIQIGLVDLWRQTFSIRADSVVGHSSGEMAAAYAAGAISAEEAILVAYFRGQATGRAAGRAGAGAGGSMAAIGLGSDDVRALLVDGAVIACENSGASTTISGDSGAVHAVVARVKSQHPGLLARPLRVDQAYHSHHMKQCVEDYHRSLTSLPLSPGSPRIPFYSTVHGRQLDRDEPLDAAYWCRNLTSPVRFHGAVQQLLKSGSENNRIFVEVGPHSALAGPMRQIFRETSASPPTYVSTVIRDHESTRSVLDAAGRLWIQGASVDFKALYPAAASAAVVPDLPPYPWRHAERFGAESRIAKEWRRRRVAPHELLGAAVLEWNDLTPTWRNQLKLEHVRWLAGHRVGGNVVFPGAGYVAMAGEAVRQLTGVAEYSLRDVVFASAMVLDEGDGDGVEVMTTLRRVRLTASLESEHWYEFEVSSFDGSAWTRHCWGQAGPGDPLGVVDPNAVSTARLPRQADATHWYRAMARAGIDYSGPFQRLSHISAHPKENVARATILASTEAMETRYQLPPSAIDAVIQLIAVASCRGQARLIDSIAVPTFISQLYVGGEGYSSLQLQASAAPAAGGGFTGDAAASAQGKAALRLRGLQASPIDDDKRATTGPPTAVELEWKPHIDFVDVGQTMRPTADGGAGFAQLERFFFLCAVDVLERLQQDIPPPREPEPHLQKLHGWLQRYVDGVLDHGSPLFGRAERLPSVQRAAEARRVYEQLLATDFHPCAVALERHRAEYVDMFAGSRAPLDVLMQDGILHRLYDFLNAWDYSRFFELLGHSQPGLRILEVGAGTGGTTAVMLDGLKGADGERLYRRYTFTDISSGFFEGARARFATWPNVDFAVLDVAQDPLGQGFEESSYDLIIAANVLHATPSLQQTLRNVRKLLRAGSGRLLLQELCPAAKWMNFLFGTLPGWWLAEDEGRAGQGEPYVDPSRWDTELRAAGFDGVEAVVYDQPPPFHINANMVARATHTQHAHDRITFLIGDGAGPGAGSLHKRLAAACEQDGLAVDWRTLADEMPEGQDVVVLLELGRPFLAEISAVQFGQLIEWAAALDGRGAGVLWLTLPSQMACPDPRYAQILGLARNIRAELSVDFATVELDDVAHGALPESLVRLYRRFEQRDRSGRWDPDFEYAIERAVPHVGRFRWFCVEHALASEQPERSDRETAAKLTIGCRGLLQTLRFSAVNPPALQPDEVRIQMRASGLNFKDVLIAMGIVPDDNLGLEGAGTIIEVGSAVADFRVGDRVMAMCREGHASHVVAQAVMCASIPDGLSFRQAATLPVVYATAIRALLDVGRLEACQTVLVHSACGGVGIAAVQICQAVGAKIFATAGTEEKRRYLADTFGIPPSRIFDSRSSSFAPAVMHATRGRGVDLVLNSLSGELLHRSWECVAEFGTLLEIGKRDLLGRGSLSLRPFEENRAYAAIDLSHICLHRKGVVKSLLERTASLYRSGGIAAIEPVMAFEARQAEDAYRFMQKGTHIGKIVLEFPSDPAELQPAAEKGRLRLRSDAAYIITGGLGGLGRATARMMAESGARRLVFISRSGRTTPSNDAFLSELEAAGCEPVAIAGSVEDEATVRRAVRLADRPVAGVVHAAMELQDCATRDMTYKAWQAVLGPRVTGVWNLHNVLLDADLDFFVLFSSLGGIVGQQGQANYAASNTFLDAFVRYRHALGLPAAAIDLGPVEDVGYVAQSPAILGRMRATHAFTLREKDVLEAVQLAIARSAPGAQRTGTSVASAANSSVFGVGLRANTSLDDPTARLIWRRDVRMAMYANLEEGNVAGSPTRSAHQNLSLKEFLASASANPAVLDEDSAVEFLGQEIGRTVSRYLMRSEDDVMPPDRTLASLGVDSLVSIEIRNWCRQQLSFDASVLGISKSTLTQLAKGAVDALRNKTSLNGELISTQEDEAREKWDRVMKHKAS